MNNQRCKNENATPKDRISEKMFLAKYGEKMPDCGDDMHRKEADTEERDELFSRCVPLAMAYVPWQEFRKLYSVEEGFERGTIFCELDFPFLGYMKGGCRR